jgi:peptidoglycan DL-endopeptidase CwlO
MSVSDVAARIQQLQGQFALLHGVGGQVRPGTLGGTAFADALSGASTPTAGWDAALSGAGAAGGGTAAAGQPGAIGSTGATRWTGALAPAADTTSSTPLPGTTGQAVVDEARKYLGVPYVWGGTNPKTGLDCSGLVQLVYEKFGVDLPRVSYQQATAGKPVASLAEARAGDLLAFGSPVRHVGIYIGDGKMIEAPRPGLEVRVIDLYEKPTAIRRVLPDSVSPAGRVGGSAVGALPAQVPYAGLFTQAAERYGVPATLLAAVARQESAYNAQAVSPAGARGLMQLMPATARGLGVNPDVPAQAVDGAARLLRDLIAEFDRVDLALAAYNAGPGAVHRYGGIPPYRETQQYVPAVLGHQRQLENA